MSPMFDSKTIFKYVVIQLAQLVVVLGIVIVVGSFVQIPALVIAVVLVLWILKDIVLYPWLWRAYAYPDSNPLSGLVGMEATAMGTLDPDGLVRVHGELWKARLMSPADGKARQGESSIERDARVKVVGMRGRTLLVEPVPPE